MKKLLLALVMLTVTMAASAKVVKITLADGSTKVYTTTQLGAIDFDDDGNATITAFDGTLLETIAANDIDDIVINEETTILETIDRNLEFSLEIVNIGDGPLYTRPGHQINFVYPTNDPFGEPIMLSGCILIPDDISNGEHACDGILLFNHYTVFHRDEAPTRGYDTLESMFLANPLMPNYIIVQSDYYGFGVTERFPQAYIQGPVNARANLDCLLAGRELLTEMDLDYGPLTFNVGYSSGGFEALQSQKVRDMEYADRISFDKTFAGGSPSDIAECYRQYVQIDETAYNAVLPLIMVSTNYTQQLGLTYEDIFQPELASHVDEYIMSKEYSSWPVCDLIGREKKVHELLNDTYCNLLSPESMSMQDLLWSLSVEPGWTPDPTQKIYLFHSRGDDYVPIQSARPIISYLKQNGFEPSLIPGKTNLQTNFIVTNMGHLTATVVYLLQSLSAIAAWPLMYTDGQLNPYYQEVLDKTDIKDPVTVLRYLEANGVDTHAIINAIIARLGELTNGEGGIGSIDMEQVQAQLNDILAQAGLTVNDLIEMSQDSGFDVMEFVVSLITYLNETEATDPAPIMRTVQQTGQIPSAANEQKLRNWLIDNGFKFNQ